VSFIGKHWKGLLVLAAVVADFAGGATYGRWSAPKPQVTEHVTTDTKTAASGRQDDHKQTGALDATIVVGGCPAAPTPAPAPDVGVLAARWDRLLRFAPRPAAAPSAQQAAAPASENPFAGLPPGSVIRLHEGPSSEDTHTSTQSSSAQLSTMDLKVAPALELPHYSLLLGGKVWPEKQLAFGGALRLPDLLFLRGYWLQGDVTPKLTDPLKSEGRIFNRKNSCPP